MPETSIGVRIPLRHLCTPAATNLYQCLSCIADDACQYIFCRVEIRTVYDRAVCLALSTYNALLASRVTSSRIMKQNVIKEAPEHHIGFVMRLTKVNMPWRRVCASGVPAAGAARDECTCDCE